MMDSHSIGTIRQTVDAKTVVSGLHATLEVNITGLRAFKFRLWVAHQIIRVLSWIVKPIKVEVKE